MSLKQSIVIVSEFTFKTKSGGGSRGATPGAYAYDYMARGDAVEPLPPVKLFANDKFDEIYRARERAMRESASVDDLKASMKSARESAGVAFGYGYVSLPQDKLVQACDDIQNQFDDGKTVFKTVISFDENYLHELGLIRDDFGHAKKGDYRGQVDQMKLRMAIMSGLDKLSNRGFDDLQYVGALQVDTHHVHCHLAIVDRGDGRIINYKTGAQKGKLSQADFDVIRKNIDSYLHQHVMTKHISPSVYDDSRNIQCYVKNYTHDLMKDRSLPQLLIACLPEDKTMWRASNTSPSMRRPNTLVREYVNSILSQPGSGYELALNRLSEQISETVDPANPKYQELYQTGREGLVRDCMNGVYQTLKTLPEEELRVRTPVLSRMSLDFETMAVQAAGSQDKITEFGFKLRSYAGRQEHHRSEAIKYHNAVTAYESSGNISESAQVVLDFMRFEEEYNSMLLAKYQHFMTFLPGEDEYEEDLRKLQQQQSLVRRLEQIQQDQRFQNLSTAEAERYGREQYQITGCGMRSADPTVFDRRIDIAMAKYNAMGEELQFGLSMYGLGIFEDEDTEELIVQKDIKYPFDDVKALDLHHLGFDFGRDIEISKLNHDAFMDVTRRRVELFNKAAEYLRLSGQEAQISQFAVSDIRRMSETARQLSQVGKLQSAVSEYVKSESYIPRNRQTVSLDFDYDEIMAKAVRDRANYQAADGDSM